MHKQIREALTPWGTHIGPRGGYPTKCAVKSSPAHRVCDHGARKMKYEPGGPNASQQTPATRMVSKVPRPAKTNHRPKTRKSKIQKSGQAEKTNTREPKMQAAKKRTNADWGLLRSAQTHEQPLPSGPSDNFKPKTK